MHVAAQGLPAEVEKTCFDCSLAAVAAAVTFSVSTAAHRYVAFKVGIIICYVC